MKTTWQVIPINGEDFLRPFDNDAKERIKEFKKNQIVVASGINGTNQERSIEQLNLYWKACEVIAENARESDKDTKEKADFWARNALKFFDLDYTYVMPCGTVVFKLMSISFDNLKHIKACDYFNSAFDLMANYLDRPVDEFISIVKSNMKRF